MDLSVPEKKEAAQKIYEMVGKREYQPHSARMWLEQLGIEVDENLMQAAVEAAAQINTIANVKDLFGQEPTNNPLGYVVCEGNGARYHWYATHPYEMQGGYALRGLVDRGYANVFGVGFAEIFVRDYLSDTRLDNAAEAAAVLKQSRPDLTDAIHVALARRSQSIEPAAGQDMTGNPPRCLDQDQPLDR
jgi:hypothetical protein